MTQDKRRGPRQLVCVLAHLEREDKQKKRSALINDISTTGAHLFTREQLKVGDRVQLALHLSDKKVIETGARVVRTTERSKDEAALWTRNVAVEFDAVIAELEGVAAKA